MIDGQTVLHAELVYLGDDAKIKFELESDVLKLPYNTSVVDNTSDLVVQLSTFFLHFIT